VLLASDLSGLFWQINTAVILAIADRRSIAVSGFAGAGPITSDRAYRERVDD
jgi:hypothetical protein